jgi:ferric-dicitrate binding protein FerR (iron transport regulator)
MRGRWRRGAPWRAVFIRCRPLTPVRLALAHGPDPHCAAEKQGEPPNDETARTAMPSSSGRPPHTLSTRRPHQRPGFARCNKARSGRVASWRPSSRHTHPSAHFPFARQEAHLPMAPPGVDRRRAERLAFLAACGGSVCSILSRPPASRRATAGAQHLPLLDGMGRRLERVRFRCKSAIVFEL